MITLRAGLARAEGWKYAATALKELRSCRTGPRGVGAVCPCARLCPSSAGSGFSAGARPLGVGRARSQALLQGLSSPERTCKALAEGVMGSGSCGKWLAWLLAGQERGQFCRH